MKLQVIFNLAWFIKADPVELHLHYSPAKVPQDYLSVGFKNAFKGEQYDKRITVGKFLTLRLELIYY